MTNVASCTTPFRQWVKYTAQTEHHKSCLTCPFRLQRSNLDPETAILASFHGFLGTSRQPQNYYLPIYNNGFLPTTLPVTSRTLIVIRGSDISKPQLLETCSVVTMFKHSLKHTHTQYVWMYMYIHTHYNQTNLLVEWRQRYVPCIAVMKPDGLLQYRRTLLLSWKPQSHGKLPFFIAAMHIDDERELKMYMISAQLRMVSVSKCCRELSAYGCQTRTLLYESLWVKKCYINLCPTSNRYATMSILMYILFNKNQAAWYFVRPAQAVTWGTAVIIIRVVLLSP